MNDLIPQPKEVHLWSACTSELRGGERLSAAEQAQAARFYFERDRIRYIASHSWLRQVLSQYIGREPLDIDFELNPFGKPSLPASAAGNITFNLSHSHDLAVLAVATGRAVGVDVEFVRDVRDAESIARHFFNADECTRIESHDTAERRRLFHTFWTRKEAFIKAVGKGLSIPLDSFDVTMPAGTPGRSMPSIVDAPGIDRWWLTDLAMPEGFAGALAIEGDRPKIVSMP